MKFFTKYESYNTFWQGRKNNFVFEIKKTGEYYYVCCEHKNLDIRYNSLWIKQVFKDLKEAQNFCQNFKSVDHKCIGVDS